VISIFWHVLAQIAAESKITRVRHFRRSEPLTGTFKEWGGWDSNPRPTDYESSLPATRLIWRDLGGHELTRS
jgi:hypothetical protein